MQKSAPGLEQRPEQWRGLAGLGAGARSLIPGLRITVTTADTTKPSSPHPPQSVPDTETPRVPPWQQKQPPSKKKSMVFCGAVTFPLTTPAAAMFPVRACDDVAAPHMSLGLTTTSGETRPISGRERGGD